MNALSEFAMIAVGIEPIVNSSVSLSVHFGLDQAKIGSFGLVCFEEKYGSSLVRFPSLWFMFISRALMLFDG